MVGRMTNECGMSNAEWGVQIQKPLPQSRKGQPRNIQPRFTAKGHEGRQNDGHLKDGIRLPMFLPNLRMSQK